MIEILKRYNRLINSGQSNDCPEFCFYTVAFGEKYKKLVQVLGFSLERFGIKLNVFTDSDNLNCCNVIKSDKFINNGYHFKIDYLKDIKKLIKSKYYVWIDCDCYCFKNPIDYLNKFKDFNFVAFPETNLILNNINVWMKINIKDMIKICDNLKINPVLYNCNGGFFIVRDYYVDDFCNKIDQIKMLGGNKWTDEHSYSIIMALVYNQDNYKCASYFNNLYIFFCDTLKISNSLMKNNVDNNKIIFETVNYFNKNEIYKLNERPCIMHFLFDEMILLKEYDKLFVK